MLQNTSYQSSSKEITITHTIITNELIVRTYFIASDGMKMAYAIPKRFLWVAGIYAALALTGLIVALVWQIQLSFIMALLAWLSPFLLLSASDITKGLGYYEVDEQGNLLRYISQAYMFTDENRMSKQQFRQSIQN